MIVVYRVGAGTTSTVPVSGRYTTYSTTAYNWDTVIANLVPDPADAQTAISVTVDGINIQRRSALHTICISETVDESDIPVAPSTLPVGLYFTTDGSGMEVTYRVGAEDAVTVDVTSAAYSYSTRAPSGATIVVHVVADSPTSTINLLVTVYGSTILDSDRIGELVKFTTVHEP